MARLAGKVAFITGGGGGIGRATAERFAEEGAKVVIAEIDVSRGDAAAESARARAKNSGGDAHFIHCDIREKSMVEAAFAETIERFGKLTILHNNAGGSTLQDGSVTDAPEEEFWRAIKLDLYGTFLCSKIGIPHIIKSGGGSIINIERSSGTRLLHGGKRRHCSADAIHGGRIRQAKDSRECDCPIGHIIGSGQKTAGRLEGHREACDHAFVRTRAADSHG
jgi:NAD(P)-dependent dehydrogenase (short-subunit alcohol dehydrogenase family)